MSGPLVELGDVSLSIGAVPVLRGITLQVGAGEALGLVGESGSGKSMTLRAIAQLLPPNARLEGRVEVDGVSVVGLGAATLREHRRRVGMVFQDPRAAVNPIHTVGGFLLERARDAGADLDDARRRAVSALKRMGVQDAERRMRQYPFELSGGLLQRVMIASVLMERPRLLLADEPTTALDVTTQSDVLALTDELRREAGTALVFVTHDLDLAAAICDRLAVVYAGRVLECGPADDVSQRPLHPYTRALLGSRPSLDERHAQIPVVPGAPVSAAGAGDGCPFVSRCPVALPLCFQRMPGDEVIGSTTVACHRADEVRRGLLDDQLTEQDGAA